MKKFRVGIIFGVLTLMLVATGCSSLVGGKWAAKVNGESILIKDYEARVSESKTVVEKKGVSFDTDQGKQILPKIQSQILERMIESTLMAQEVKNLSLNLEDAAVKEQEDSLKKGIGDEAKFQDTLKETGMTELDLKNYFASHAKITADVKVSEAEVKDYFDKNMAYYNKPESVTARHILLSTEEEAKAIIVQLKEGADFAQLAKDKSIDTRSKESGGELDPFTRGRMVPEFETAAFAQKEGTISEVPIKTTNGYHVIKVEAHTMASTPDYEKDKPQLEKDALIAAKDTKFQTYFEDLKKKAKIEYSKGYQPAS